MTLNPSYGIKINGNVVTHSQSALLRTIEIITLNALML